MVGVDRQPSAPRTVRGAKNSFREFHSFLAEMLHLPELEMSEEKAQRFASAYHEFRRHFPVPAVNPKWVALATFVYVGYDTYQPAVKALAARKRGDVARPLSPLPTGAPIPPAPSSQGGAPETNGWFTAPGLPN